MCDRQNKTSVAHTTNRYTKAFELVFEVVTDTDLARLALRRSWPVGSEHRGQCTQDITGLSRCKKPARDGASPDVVSGCTGSERLIRTLDQRDRSVGGQIRTELSLREKVKPGLHTRLDPSLSCRITPTSISSRAVSMGPQELVLLVLAGWVASPAAPLMVRPSPRFASGLIRPAGPDRRLARPERRGLWASDQVCAALTSMHIIDAHTLVSPSRVGPQQHVHAHAHARARHTTTRAQTQAHAHMHTCKECTHAYTHAHAHATRPRARRTTGTMARRHRSRI